MDKAASPAKAKQFPLTLQLAEQVRRFCSPLLMLRKFSFRFADDYRVFTDSRDASHVFAGEGDWCER